jgi:gas vesicle protein
MVEGILLGASMGAAAALLAAPRAQKAIKKAGSLYSEAHERTDDILTHAAKSAECRLQRVKDILTGD